MRRKLAACSKTLHTPTESQASALAAKGFRGYGPEADQSSSLRSSNPVPLTVFETLRKLRAMLKSSGSDEAFDLIEFICDLDPFQAIAFAKQNGRLIVPNIVYDRILALTDSAYKIRGWTGTMIINEAPDQPFGFQVSSNRVLFKVPDQFLGVRNCALVMEHPDFDLVDKEDGTYHLMVPDVSDLHLVENFPTETGKFDYCEDSFRIPVVKAGEMPGEQTRYLYRSETSYISLLHRETFGMLGWGRDVYAALPHDFYPSFSHSVALLKE